MSARSGGEAHGTRLQTVERALAFLEAVAECPEPLLVREAAVRLGLNLSTAYHLLNTLELAGYVAKDDKGRIRIGSKVALLFEAFTREFESSRTIWPVVHELSERSGETAYLAGLRHGGVTIEYLVESQQAVRVAGLYLGLSGAEHIRASGKAVLAYLPEREREEIIDRLLTARADSEREKALCSLKSERRTIIRQGYALDAGAFLRGVTCIAAGFFNHAGGVAGALSLALPTERFNRSPASYRSAIRDAARAATEALGPPERSQPGHP